MIKITIKSGVVVLVQKLMKNTQQVVGELVENIDYIIDDKD